MKYKVISLILFLMMVAFSFDFKNEIKPAKIIHAMNDSIKSIKTLRAKVSSLERIERSFSSAHSEVKIQTSPRKIYFINKLKKLEILFNPDISKYKAIVKPHVFPYITLSLDPTGNIMRKNQHYTINELGYEFIGKSLALTVKKDIQGVNSFTYKGKHLKNGYLCYLLEYENNQYDYTDYIVGEKETVSFIAYKLCVNDYLLRYKNDLLNEFSYLRKGRVLKVPTLYCKRAILYIDEKLMLPISLSLFDDVGLFESYEYSDLIINKPFKENDFLKNNKEYGF
jgi:hypothetical protein